MMNWYRVIVLIFLTGAFFRDSSGAERVALVVGIDRYDHLPEQGQLDVAVTDARLMAKTLRGLDPPFSVKLLTDVRQREVMEELTGFVDEANGAECALVYFAGHGVEYHGSNFLLARDTEVARISADVERMKRRLRLAALPLQAIVDELDGTGAQVKVVILDACRNNPLRVDDGTGTRNVFGGTRGLAQVTPPSGTLIAYSADAGQQANDGLFTEVLAKHLKAPGLPLLEVFAATREEVVKRSTALAADGRGVRHEPAEYTKLNRAGTRFAFSIGNSVPSKAEVEKLREQIASMAKLIEELEAKGQRVEALKEQLAVMEAAEKETPVTEPEPVKKSTPSIAMIPKPADGGGFPTKAESRGFTNSLGMEFVPVPGTDVLFSVYETRVKDFIQFLAENPESELGGLKYKDPDHPVSNVTWKDAISFCSWLSQKEGKTYRLPTDHEWSVAVGIGDTEKYLNGSDSLSPSEKKVISGVFPWGSQITPPKGTGNFHEDVKCDEWKGTSPVGSFELSHHGIKDLSGNVSEWVMDKWDSSSSFRTVRGSSYLADFMDDLISSHRRKATAHKYDIGFRCVLERRTAQTEEIEHFKSGANIQTAPPATETEPVKKSNPPIAMIPKPVGGGGFTTGQSRGFTNSLGMEFVPVPGTDVLFSVYETRVKDYAAYAAENSGVREFWKDYEYKGHGQTSDHPVVKVSWEDAVAFCAWLSKKEGRTYRLPTDHEWSVAVGIGDRENASASPESKSLKISDVYPWGTSWPPPGGVGNYRGQEATENSSKIDGFRDNHPATAPVGSYSPNRFGLYDLGGNVREWCEDWYNSDKDSRVLRDGSWFDFRRDVLSSSFRMDVGPTNFLELFGFRCVVEVGAR